ncbi:MAG TPA: cell division protein FtsL [Pseudogracilibacillus sp.]|nr:cell division protein FtsL [Pseudogracilibacillus sp.]
MSTSEAKKLNATPKTTEINNRQTDHEKVHIKVTQSGKITKGERYIYTFFSIILILFTTYIVFYSSQTDTLNREFQSYEETVSNQQFINEGLTFEVKELSRPERITKIAKDKGLKIQDAQVKKVNRVQE